MPEILESPVTDGKPVEGVCNGRMVAYWPREGEHRAIDGTYIPAMIVTAWNYGQAIPMPVCNIQLFVDGLNHKLDNLYLGSVRYSSQPAKGCWTWIPKA